jgi:hypothetical protein
MSVRHPRGYGIRRRAHDHLDASLSHGIHDAVHPGVLKVSVGRLP